MTSVTIKAVCLLALPVVAFLGGVKVMGIISHRQEVQRQLREAAEPEDRKPLGRRGWYDSAAAERHWQALDTRARGYEQLFLELDLVFPFLYGGALTTSLLVAWAALGRPFSPLWALLPVILTLLADWTENLVQLAQLRAYMTGGHGALVPGWFHVASSATLAKLVWFGGSSLLLAVLVGSMLSRGWKLGQ